MNTAQRIGRNAAALYGAHIVSALVFLFLSIFIARILGDVTYGKFSFAYAFAAILAVFLSLGFDTIIVREVARDRSLAAKYLGNIAAIKVILSLVTLGLTILVINLMHYPFDTTTAVLIFGVYAIFTAFATIFKVTFRAFERMGYEALTGSVGRLVTFSLGLAALFLGYGLIGVVCTFLIGIICDLLLSSFICNRKFVRLKLEIDLEFWKKATKAAIPIGFLYLASTVFVRVDTVMLSVMKGDAVVGWYNVAYNLVLGLKPIPFIFVSVILPVMARFSISSTSSLRFTYEKSLRYLFALGLPLAVGTMLLSSRLILLFYGEQFTHSIVALQILAWDILLFFLYSGLGTLLISIDRQNRMAIACGICALVNVILNLVLIPHFSYVGAGIATIATEVILLGLYCYFASKYFYRLSLSRIVAKPIIACAVMATFVYFCQSFNLAVLIILAIVIYFAMLFLIKGVSQEDMDLLKQIIKIPKASRK